MFCRCFGRPLSLHFARVAARYLPDRFDPTWEEIACVAVDVGGHQNKTGAYLCRMCAPMSSSFQAFVTHNFVTRSLVSFTHNFHTHPFHTQLCHNLSFTHIFVTHHLSHTTLSHFVAHRLLHKTVSHTALHIQLVLPLDPPPIPLSFLPRPSTAYVAHYIKEEVGLWGYPVL